MALTSPRSTDVRTAPRSSGTSAELGNEGQKVVRLQARAYGLIAAAVLSFVGGQVFAIPALLYFAIALITIPLSSVVYLKLRTPRLTVQRSSVPAVAQVGSEVTVLLDATGDRSGSPLLCEDRVPRALGRSPRFVIDSAVDSQVRVQYRLTAHKRGKWVLGPLRYRTIDPLGMATVRGWTMGSGEVTVVPQVHPITFTPRTGSGRGAGRGEESRVSQSGIPASTVRPYREGDELRRIHWRTTARRNTLMVRNQYKPAAASAGICVDVRQCAYPGREGAAAFEVAISAAASLADHLLCQGWHVYVISAGHTVHALSNEPVGLQRILIDLAAAQPLPGSDLGGLFDEVATIPNLATVALIMGETQADDLAALERWTRIAQSGSAMFISSEAGQSPTQSDVTPNAVSTLRQCGWAATRIDYRTSVPDAISALHSDQPGHMTGGNAHA